MATARVRLRRRVADEVVLILVPGDSLERAQHVVRVHDHETARALGQHVHHLLVVRDVRDLRDQERRAAVDTLVQRRVRIVPVVVAARRAAPVATARGSAAAVAASARGPSPRCTAARASTTRTAATGAPTARGPAAASSAPADWPATACSAAASRAVSARPAATRTLRECDNGLETKPRHLQERPPASFDIGERHASPDGPVRRRDQKGAGRHQSARVDRVDGDVGLVALTDGGLHLGVLLGAQRESGGQPHQRLAAGNAGQVLGELPQRDQIAAHAELRRGGAQRERRHTGGAGHGLQVGRNR